MKFVELVRKMEHRIFLSVMSGMLVCTLFFGNRENQGVLAWWGFLYPEYCFVSREIEAGEMKGKGRDEDEEVMETGDVKISFWLAKAFDW